MTVGYRMGSLFVGGVAEAAWRASHNMDKFSSWDERKKKKQFNFVDARQAYKLNEYVFVSNSFALVGYVWLWLRQHYFASKKRTRFHIFGWVEMNDRTESRKPADAGHM